MGLAWVQQLEGQPLATLSLSAVQSDRQRWFELAAKCLSHLTALQTNRWALQASIFWHRMRQLQDENLTVYVKVESANRGGLLVKYGPYDGFIPVSQFGPVSACFSMQAATNKTSDNVIRINMAHNCSPYCSG